MSIFLETKTFIFGSTQKSMPGLLPTMSKDSFKRLFLCGLSFLMILSTYFWTFYNNDGFFSYVFDSSLFKKASAILNIDFFFGFDGLSYSFFLLTLILTFLCILFIWNEYSVKNYIILLIAVKILLFLTFTTFNLFLFYVFFECILIPMYLMIGLWGSREKKIRASYLLFFYTVFGSILLLLSIICIHKLQGNFHWGLLTYTGFTIEYQLFFWLAFFFAFASKIPMFPFHIWLPEAHVEAPTVGSVLLAGVLLKLGVYGFVRYSLMLFPNGSYFFIPFVYALSLFGILVGSLNAIKQTDLKKVIAYSSIAHMNLVVLGIFSFNLSGLEGVILQSVSHGFVASALFFIIGILYNRYHSRLLYYYGGLVHVMPICSSFMLFFIFSNIALPGTSSFVGEFLLLNGIFQQNFYCSILASLSVILSGAYSLWLYNRVNFGNLKVEYLKKFQDISAREFFILYVLFHFSLILGLNPDLLLDLNRHAVLNTFVFSNFFTI